VEAMAAEEFPGGAKPTREEIEAQAAEYLTQMRKLPGRTVLEAPAQLREPAQFDGLGAGSYSLSVEIGKSWDSPLVLGQTDVLLEVGRTREVTLRVTSPQERRRVPVSGTLFLPPEWGRTRLSLDIDPIDIEGKTAADERDIELSSMQPVGGAEGLFRWDAGLLVPGWYEVTCYGLDCQWSFDTGPDGRSDVQIVVGAPADVQVLVLDEDTGNPLSDLEVRWNGRRPERVNGGSLESASWNATTGTHDFRAPAGGVELSISGLEYRVVGDGDFEVDPGPNRLTLRVRHTCGFVLTFKVKGALIPVEEDVTWNVKAKAVDGSGWTSGRGDAKDYGIRLTVSEPGQYEVKVPTPTGFQPIPPLLIDVPVGTYVAHVIELRAVQ